MCLCVSTYDYDFLFAGGIRIIYFPQENNSISIIISSLFLFISSPPFRIQCQGSGDITWINPSGEPVTSNYTSVPHQSSNGILNFTQSPTNGELYTCVSDTWASDSVIVTIGKYSASLLCVMYLNVYMYVYLLVSAFGSLPLVLAYITFIYYYH